MAEEGFKRKLTCFASCHYLSEQNWRIQNGMPKMSD